SVCTEIDNIKSLFSYRCRKEKVTLTSSCDTTIKIKGSSVRFNQCLSNIVSNALDAHTLSKRSHKTIGISVQKNPSDISITITDNANGIAPTTLNKIFNPFFTTKSIEKGTGIGLSMTKNIIEEAFRGTISAKSTPKIGTTFTITLPT
ncbi:HAMP domain-containing histidine kinase, partial [Candidatus Woesebacteria bacterium]|nr:HAMP domain-containing histidine kinase [Candidatus Woesebacteria bacterium]